MKNEFDYLNDVKMDFSLYGEEILSEKEIRNMKRSAENKTRRRGIAIAAAAAAAITGTAFASGFAGNIIRQISTGHNTVMQTDPNKILELPENLQGKFFDENGTPIGALSQKDFDNLYDADGNKLSKSDYADIVAEAYGGEAKVSENGEVKISLPNDKDLAAHEHDFADADDAAAQASFDLKLPQALPDGYALDRVYTYTNDDGSYTGNYVTLEYKNGKDRIIMYERAINDETAFSASTDDEIKEVDINGSAAVLEGSRIISWETNDDVSVSVQMPDGTAENDTISFAESVK